MGKGFTGCGPRKCHSVLAAIPSWALRGEKTRSSRSRPGRAGITPPDFCGSGNPGKARQRIQYPATAQTRARVWRRPSPHRSQSARRNQTGITRESGRNPERSGSGPADLPCQGPACSQGNHVSVPHRPRRGKNVQPACVLPAAVAATASVGNSVGVTMPVLDLAAVAPLSPVRPCPQQLAVAILSARCHVPVPTAVAFQSIQCAVPDSAAALTTSPPASPTSPGVQNAPFSLGPCTGGPDPPAREMYFSNRGDASDYRNWHWNPGVRKTTAEMGDFPHFSYESPAANRCGQSPDSCTRPRRRIGSEKSRAVKGGVCEASSETAPAIRTETPRVGESDSEHRIVIGGRHNAARVRVAGKLPDGGKRRGTQSSQGLCRQRPALREPRSEVKRPACRCRRTAGACRSHGPAARFRQLRRSRGVAAGACCPLQPQVGDCEASGTAPPVMARWVRNSGIPCCFCTPPPLR